MRPGLLTRLFLLLVTLSVIGGIVMFGRRLGASEIVIVGSIVVLILLAEGVRVVLAGFIKGYRGQR